MSGARYQTNNKETEYFLSQSAVGSLDSRTQLLYQGKEFMSDFGFNLQDFDARMFDSQLGRWHAIDPVMQFASPYVGMGNNPVSLTDQDGRSVPDDDVPPGWIPSCDEVEIIGYLDHEGGIPFIGYELDYYSGGSYNPFDGQNSTVSHGSGGNAGGQGGNGVGNSVNNSPNSPISEPQKTPEEILTETVFLLFETLSSLFDSEQGGGMIQYGGSDDASSNHYSAEHQYPSINPWPNEYTISLVSKRIFQEPL